MQLIISVLILFILINCVLKLSFWRIWQAALFGACLLYTSPSPRD